MLPRQPRSTLFPYTTLSDLPTLPRRCGASSPRTATRCAARSAAWRSEEHTSELQSRGHLVCRLLPEKKQTIKPRRARRCAKIRVEDVIWANDTHISTTITGT